MIAALIASPSSTSAEPGQGLETHFELLTPPARPTKVDLGVYLLGISKVSEPKEPFPSFVAEVFLEARWNDPRLAYDPEVAGTKKKVLLNGQVEKAITEMWWPGISIENEKEKRHIEVREIAILPNGDVLYDERFHVEVHADLDLRRFPFDAQTFKIVFGSFAWNEKDLNFTVLDNRTGYDADHHTLEWEVLGVDAEVHSKKEIRSKHAFSELVYTIQVQRQSGYYIWKLIVPLLIIALLSWSTFWMTGEPAATRMQRCFIAMLSVVAFHRVVADNQPRISYLSFMDGIVYMVFLVSFLAIMQVIATHQADRAGRPELVRRLDYHARWLFPALMAGIYSVLWIAAH